MARSGAASVGADVAAHHRADARPSRSRDRGAVARDRDLGTGAVGLQGDRHARVGVRDLSAVDGCAGVRGRVRRHRTPGVLAHAETLRAGRGVLRVRCGALVRGVPAHQRRERHDHRRAGAGVHHAGRRTLVRRARATARPVHGGGVVPGRGAGRARLAWHAQLEPGGRCVRSGERRELDLLLALLQAGSDVGRRAGGRARVHGQRHDGGGRRHDRAGAGVRSVARVAHEGGLGLDLGGHDLPRFRRAFAGVVVPSPRGSMARLAHHPVHAGGRDRGRRPAPR